MDELGEYKNFVELGEYKNLIILGFIVILVVFVILYIATSKKRRKHFLFHWNWLMYFLGINTYISRKYVGRVHVHENRDFLVEFIPNEKIIIDESTVEQPVMLRRKVVVKLEKVARKLPEDTYLKVYSAFKSREKQNVAWKNAIEEATKLHPQAAKDEILKMARFKASDPSHGLGGHETGGAIDVALCDKNGEDWDFGTEFHEHNDYTATKNNYLTKEQKRNRNYLVKIMRKQGFVNFPGEWWHFSYGDRMWAAYKGRRNGVKYGSAEKDFNGKYIYVIPVKRLSPNPNYR